METRELDLAQRMELALRNMRRSLDERQGDLPFFTYSLFDTPVRAHHGAFDSPHVVGRFLNSIHHIRRSFGISAPGDLVDRLARLLLPTVARVEGDGAGLAWNQQTPAQPAGALGHNQREALLGLISLAWCAGSSEAYERAQALIRACRRHVGSAGQFPGGLYQAGRWVRSGMLDEAPAQSGRMIRALLLFHRLDGDLEALELARTLAQHNAAVCFTDEGRITAQAGTHVHSITGTITALLDLGIYLKDAALIERARRAFDVGTLPYRSSFGWVQEIIGSKHERGEANNSGDILESMVLIARHLDRRYWSAASKTLQNHLVRSQFADPGLFETSGGAPEGDAAEVIDRALGGFFFTSPADFKSHPEDHAPINTDLVGGATEGICEAYSAAHEDDGVNLRIHLVVTRRSSVCDVQADPSTSRLDITLREPRALSVRVPDNTQRDRVSVLFNGEPVAPTVVDNYLHVGGTRRWGRVRVEFPPKAVSETFILNGSEYRGVWVGERLQKLSGSQVLFKEIYS